MIILQTNTYENDKQTINYIADCYNDLANINCPCDGLGDCTQDCNCDSQRD